MAYQHSLEETRFQIDLLEGLDVQKTTEHQLERHIEHAQEIALKALRDSKLKTDELHEAATKLLGILGKLEEQNFDKRQRSRA